MIRRPPSLTVVGCLLSLICPVALSAAERIAFTWPTPLKAFEQRQRPETIFQHAGSGDPASGGYGGVRTNGSQFHEGIDIRPVARDRAGDATDPIFAAMDGIVRYVNLRPGESSYGRYILIEHPAATPAVYTLYAHLAKVSTGVVAGTSVTRGQVIGTMGHSGGFPKDRSHLHFEIGLWITRDFQSWYNFRKFGSPNQHGNFNGMNLMGFDPYDFLVQWRDRRVDNFAQYLGRLETAVRVRIATTRTPDFAERYPSLVTREKPVVLGGWEVQFSWTGLPIALTPLTPTEVAGLPANSPRIVEVNADLQRTQRSRSLAVARGRTWAVGSDLLTVLQQLFALR